MINLSPLQLWLCFLFASLSSFSLFLWLWIRNLKSKPEARFIIGISSLFCCLAMMIISVTMFRSQSALISIFVPLPEPESLSNFSDTYFSATAPKSVDLLPWIGLGYGLVSLVLAIRVFVAMFNVFRIQKGCTQLNLDPSLDIENLPIRRIATSISVNSPVVIGIRNPILVVPKSLAPSLSNIDWEIILCHESAHVLGHHIIFGFFRKIISIVLWPIPFFHAIGREIVIAQEQICDAQVLQSYSAIEYSKLLLKCIEFQAGRNSIELTCGFLGHFQSLDSRIKNLLSHQIKEQNPMKTSTKIAILAGLLMPATLIGGTQFAFGQVSNEHQQISDQIFEKQDSIFEDITSPQQRVVRKVSDSSKRRERNKANKSKLAQKGGARKTTVKFRIVDPSTVPATQPQSFAAAPSRSQNSGARIIEGQVAPTSPAAKVQSTTARSRISGARRIEDQGAPTSPAAKVQSTSARSRISGARRLEDQVAPISPAAKVQSTTASPQISRARRLEDQGAPTAPTAKVQTTMKVLRDVPIVQYSGNLQIARSAVPPQAYTTFSQPVRLSTTSQQAKTFRGAALAQVPSRRVFNQQAETFRNHYVAPTSKLDPIEFQLGHQSSNRPPQVFQTASTTNPFGGRHRTIVRTISKNRK